ncbi:ribonuclease R [Thermanaeromonas sp. C210]|uniref:ribonuclease R n=1 Tax=Thermanaeromonas sp. C210 TaxID=2731925 RepID=UPI0015649474|nr:ribonuclease R [Thermanaeromonas sp. C210]
MEAEKVLDFMRHKSYRPMTLEELGETLGIEYHALQELLHELETEGRVVRTRKNKYGVPEKMGLAAGKLQVSPRGFAFLLPLEREQEDIYISPGNLNGAMHQDLVLARLLPDQGTRRREGEVIRVLKRANSRVVGTYERNRRVAFVVPDDPHLQQDIFIPLEESKGARHRDKVVVEITRWPAARRNPEGRIIEVLGPAGAPGVDVLSIIKKYNLDPDFPPAVKREAKKIREEIAAADLEGRRDLRDWRLVTIDGADAKDLDDAVSIERMPDGNFLLGVHIADVSYYVKEGGALDKEAFRRGTSVYMVDRVIPMLPPRLSNGICSLNAGADRLAMSVVMEVSPQGKVVDYEIFPSVIRVRERMTYDAVRRILVDRDPDLMARYRDLVEDFRLMEALCLILYEKRMKRGAIDFDFPEAKVVLDENGRPVEIIRVERSIAERIIEEFMVLANEVVARHLHFLEIPLIYRVHEEPAPDKLDELNRFLGPLGYRVRRDAEGRIHPKVLQRIVTEMRGRPEERVINTVILRSLMRARYAPGALGHFGLASQYYCHFTSPIRRYPDLVVHRILREVLAKGKIHPRRLEKMKELVARAAAQASEQERIAEEAERESLLLKMVEYMKERIGEVHPGTISGVVPYGFFVELENTVEGLVHVSTLTDDYYYYQEDQMALVGVHTRKSFRIGQRVQVQVIRVSVEARQVDLELV